MPISQVPSAGSDALQAQYHVVLMGTRTGADGNHPHFTELETVALKGWDTGPGSRGLEVVQPGWEPHSLFLHAGRATPFLPPQACLKAAVSTESCKSLSAWGGGRSSCLASASGEPVWASSFEGSLQTHEPSIHPRFNESLLCARNSSRSWRYMSD